MHSYEDFLQVIETLRGENGCPWDREQTHASLTQCMLEEAYEVIDGIRLYEETGEDDNLREELGDVLLQVVMHAQIAKEEGRFSMEDVVDGICEKMIHRHPHVFGERTLKDSQQVLEQWEEIKKKEKKEENLRDTLERVAKAYPANIRAAKVQKKAEKAGILLESEPHKIIAGMRKQLEELENCLHGEGQGEETTGELDKKIGELMFSTVLLSGKMGLEAENSLTNATNQFINRCVDITYF